jgi:hypothetical protein
MVLQDEIAQIEQQGLARTTVGDWAGARSFFDEALLREMPALRRGQILRNVASTYAKEGNHEAVARTVQRAIGILDAAGEPAPRLRRDLQNLLTFWAGTLPLGTWWYWVALVAGIYWGISFASGATFVGGIQMNPLTVIIVPIALSAGTAILALRELSLRFLVGATTLLADFAFGFAVGYGVATSGLIRFSYGPTP